LARVSIFLIIVALIAGMVGCDGGGNGSDGGSYTLTVNSTAGGVVAVNDVIIPGKTMFIYDPGTVVSLNATPDVGYCFVEWTGNVSTVGNVTAAITNITMNGNYYIMANFVMVYDLTISSSAGGSVMTPGEGTFAYAEETAVNLVATPDACCYFVNWTGDVGTIANINAASTTITMNSDYSINANFEGEEAVIFPDPNLEAAIREAIGKPTDPICPSDLEGLTYLNASGNNITDLTGLEHCTSLTRLYLGINQISDISPLANLTNLTQLGLEHNQISDISPLANLTNLTVLPLHNNQISDISPLTNLTNLTELFLADNQISDISPLANLTNHTRLYLNGNQISDISSLANLTNLTQLGLSDNQISDISPLTNLTGLYSLSFQYNQISDISPLASLTNLGHLNLRGNQISDISPLANLTNLESLDLWHNQISDISPLANLTNLTVLTLHNNQISDIEPLVNNPGLSQGDSVYLGANPLSETSINTYIPQLEARGVTVYW
jgi:internalin A